MAKHPLVMSIGWQHVSNTSLDTARLMAGVNTLRPMLVQSKLHETFLPPFKSAIDAGVKALMPGFHALDRIPVTAHQELLVEVLRDAWQFEGAVISDYTAIKELIAHGLGNSSDVAVAAMRATIDMDMVGETYANELSQLVQEKRISNDAIDQACRRILKLKFELGLFDDPMLYLDDNRAKQFIGSTEIRDEARAIVSRCCVLLKNDQDVLPLATDKSIALIGPLADDRSNLPGTWSISANVDECVSLYDGIREVVGDEVRIEISHGCNLTDDPQLAERLNVHGETVKIDERPVQAIV